MGVVYACPTCAKPMLRGRCEDCSRLRIAVGAPARPKGKRRYDPGRDGMRRGKRAWNRLSKAFRAKHPLCEACKSVGVYKSAQLVDHILGIWAFPELEFEESNLQSMCVKCHTGEKRRLEGIGEFVDYRRRRVIRLSDAEFAAAKERERFNRSAARARKGLTSQI